MNYFVSTITAETTSTFFLIGAAFYTAYFILSVLITLISESYLVVFASAILGGTSLKAVIAKAQSIKFDKENGNHPDVLRGALILICGVISTLSLYALCDGVPRFYAIAFMLVGGIAARFLLTGTFYILVIHIIVPISYLLFSILLLPFRLIYRIKTECGK